MSKANKIKRINVRVTEYDRDKLQKKARDAGFDNFSTWVLHVLRKEGA